VTEKKEKDMKEWTLRVVMVVLTLLGGWFISWLNSQPALGEPAQAILKSLQEEPSAWRQVVEKDYRDNERYLLVNEARRLRICQGTFWADVQSASEGGDGPYHPCRYLTVGERRAINQAASQTWEKLEALALTRQPKQDPFTVKQR
jgi:hypothetical protein